MPNPAPGRVELSTIWLVLSSSAYVTRGVHMIGPDPTHHTHAGVTHGHTPNDSPLGMAVAPPDAPIEVMRFETGGGRTGRNGEGARWYGCWFFPAPGSGIWISTNRTLTLAHKDEALGRAPLGVRGGSTDMLSAYMRKHHAEGNERLRELVLSDRFSEAQAMLAFPSDAAFVTEYYHRDGFLPYLAHSLAYDTLQVQFPFPELIVARSECMHGERSIRTCVPVRLSAGWQANRPCTCSEDVLSLNCDSTSRTRSLA